MWVWVLVFRALPISQRSSRIFAKFRRKCLIQLRGARSRPHAGSSLPDGRRLSRTHFVTTHVQEHWQLKKFNIQPSILLSTLLHLSFLTECEPLANLQTPDMWLHSCTAYGCQACMRSAGTLTNFQMYLLLVANEPVRKLLFYILKHEYLVAVSIYGIVIFMFCLYPVM